MTLEGNPWFVAADVCRAFDYKNPTELVRYLDPSEKAKSFLGFGAEANVVSESGLYKLVLRAQRSHPQAKAFQDWVTKEVLPSIRKTGSYVTGQPSLQENPQMDPLPRLAALAASGEVNGLPIVFREDGYINMTKAAKLFPGKRLPNFWRSPDTQEYIEALEPSLNLSVCSINQARWLQWLMPSKWENPTLPSPSVAAAAKKLGKDSREFLKNSSTKSYMDALGKMMGIPLNIQKQATKVAQAYGKRPSHFLELPTSLEYMEALANALNVGKSVIWAAKAFGKKLSNFWDSPQTMEYMKALTQYLSQMPGFQGVELVIAKKGRCGFLYPLQKGSLIPSDSAPYTIH